jgi:hypothetical protein
VRGKDPFLELRRSKEEEYFRKKERKLIDKMRRRAALEDEFRQLTESTGVTDERILLDLKDLGYTVATVKLLYLLPLIQVGWADNKLTRQEARRIREAALVRGIAKDSEAMRLLDKWLQNKPSNEFFERSFRIVKEILRLLPTEERKGRKQTLVSQCYQIAQASGRILGFGESISREEKALLQQIARELEYSPESEDAAKGKGP